MAIYTSQTSALPYSDRLTRIPVELATVVFCHLSSFQDVFDLALTCHHLRDV